MDVFFEKLWIFGSMWSMALRAVYERWLDGEVGLAEGSPLKVVAFGT
jgi:hypothetical protein